MRKFLTIIALAAIILVSCSTKVDLYCYDGDTTIVYSVLEVNADTNYFRITKSSLVNEMMYNYDDIDVRFAGLFKNEPQADTITLDTISKMVDGEMRLFYYTTKKLLDGEEYTLLVHRRLDDVTVSSKIKTVCDITFQKPMGKYINFRTNSIGKIQWIGRGTDIAPLINAGYCEVYGYFHYKELMPGAVDTVEQSIEWLIRSDQAKNFYNTSEYYYLATYRPMRFFEILESDEYLNNHSPLGVQRWLMPYEVKIVIYGEELYKYFIINNATSAIQEVPNYTNVVNGIGLMTSRTEKNHFYVIEQICRKRISLNYPYGFYYDPNL